MIRAAPVSLGTRYAKTALQHPQTLACNRCNPRLGSDYMYTKSTHPQNVSKDSRFIDTLLYPLRMSSGTWHPERPYDDLPLLPPSEELETTRVLKACITARAALAELSQAVKLIPNQSMLISTLPMLE